MIPDETKQVLAAVGDAVAMVRNELLVKISERPVVHETRLTSPAPDIVNNIQVSPTPIEFQPAMVVNVDAAGIIAAIDGIKPPTIQVNIDMQPLLILMKATADKQNDLLTQLLEERAESNAMMSQLLQVLANQEPATIENKVKFIVPDNGIKVAPQELILPMREKRSFTIKGPDGVIQVTEN